MVDFSDFFKKSGFFAKRCEQQNNKGKQNTLQQNNEHWNKTDRIKQDHSSEKLPSGEFEQVFCLANKTHEKN